MTKKTIFVKILLFLLKKSVYSWPSFWYDIIIKLKINNDYLHEVEDDEEDDEEDDPH